ncbi:MFS transporter [Arthrobacter sp. U41]|uniref:MFS transporter n=1 Tax=Arthrobacter sp. U41 TaxID=1849032 RepID=UPI0018D32BD0|nr:MFS transporter [Arthrobacter sp. U41]
MTNPGRPSRVAYWGLLGSSTLATLSSNILNAPLEIIRTELSSSVAEIVLMVSAFTVVLTVAVPVAGWWCDRFGNRRMLVSAFALMVAADLAGSMAETVGMLVPVRGLQGLATSFIAPTVQKSLFVIWPDFRKRSLALWASALGIGQAVGPLAGGAISQTLGWRAVFIVHAVLCAAMLFLLLATLPRVVDRTVRTNVAGLLLLMAGTGGVVIGLTLFAQRTVSSAAIISGLLGSVLLVGFVWVAYQRPDDLIDPRQLIGRTFAGSAAGASAAMFAMGSFLVATPLFLSARLNTRPDVIGVILCCLAIAMSLGGPLTGVLCRKWATSVAMRLGLLVNLVAAAGMGLVLLLPTPLAITVAVTLLLTLAGFGISIVQSTSAEALAASPPGRSGFGIGIHNMLKFAGMAVAYAWIAAFPPGENPLLTYMGVAVGIAAVFVFVWLTGEAAPPSGGRRMWSRSRARRGSQKGPGEPDGGSCEPQSDLAT